MRSSPPEWAAIVGGSGGLVATGAEVPPREILEALAAGTGASPLVASGAAGPDDLAVAPMPARGATLLAGRSGHPFRTRERRQLLTLARIADRLPAVGTAVRPVLRSGLGAVRSGAARALVGATRVRVAVDVAVGELVELGVESQVRVEPVAIELAARDGFSHRATGFGAVRGSRRSGNRVASASMSANASSNPSSASQSPTERKPGVSTRSAPDGSKTSSRATVV